MLDTATCVDGSIDTVEQAGDVSCCMRCGEAMVFVPAHGDPSTPLDKRSGAQGLTLRALAPEEFLDLTIETRRTIIRMRDFVCRMREAGKF